MNPGVCCRGFVVDCNAAVGVQVEVSGIASSQEHFSSG